MGVPNFALSDDNKTYAASCLDSKIRLVDRDGGEILKEYSGHRANNFKLGVAYNKGDAYILSMIFLRKISLIKLKTIVELSLV